MKTPNTPIDESTDIVKPIEQSTNQSSSPIVYGARGSSRVLLSLTFVFFVFGIGLAFGVRQIEAVRQKRVVSAQNVIKEKTLLKDTQATLEREEKDRKMLQVRIGVLQKELANGGRVNEQQAKRLNGELKKLQTLLGITPVTGPGVVIRLSDNPDAASAQATGPFLPGIVHDFDLLQVVNELRSAKAEAIAINGERVTGFTPIRCVGPVIYINFASKPAPFEIMAIGNPSDLKNALSMPGGILENLKEQTLGVQITERSKLSLPAAEGVPDVRRAKIAPTPTPKPTTDSET